jgi:hypothetical protein
MKNLFKKFFLVKEIKSKAGKLHFRRYRIIETPWLNIYIHRIYMADADEHEHDHPWDFCIFVLSGGYVEQSNDGYYARIPGSFVRHSAEYSHRIISLNNKPSTTLVMTGPRRREWGYKISTTIWANHKAYRDLKRKSK